MKKVLVTALAAGLVLTLGFGLFVLQAPQMRFALWPQQSFAPVASDQMPTAGADWTSSARELYLHDLWPDLSEALKDDIKAKGGLEFPILVPKGFAETKRAMAASNFRIELLNNGYYVVLQSATMELMIMGTAIAHHAEGGQPLGVQGDYIHDFQDPGPRPAGGRITFGAYGADYSVTFDCRVTDPGLTRNCVSDQKARALVKALISGAPSPLILPDFAGS